MYTFCWLERGRETSHMWRIPYFCTCRQSNQCWGTHNKISRDHPERRSFSEWYESPRIWWRLCDEWAREWCANTDSSSNPNAIYVHCRPHVLNLCIVHASKLPLTRNIMDTMQEVTLAFKFFAKRLLVFKEQLGDNPIAKDVNAFKVLTDINNLNP